MYISVLRFYPEDLANIINDFQKKKREGIILRKFSLCFQKQKSHLSGGLNIKI